MNTISLLDSVSEIVDNRGKTCPTSEYGIALIATNCVKSSNLFPTKERIRYVNQHTFDNWFRGHPQPGDIMFVNKGSPGEVCLVPNDVDFCFAQDMVALRANKEKIDPLYFFAVLRSQKVKKMIRNMHVGTMIPHFKKTDFKKIDLPLPSRKIQEFIGNYYYSCSKKIHLNKKTNQTLEKIVKTIFKSWFVNFDPVREKIQRKSTKFSNEVNELFPDSFVNSELGKIPKGWTILNINDVCNTTDFVANGSFATLKENVSKIENPQKDSAIFLRFTDFSSDWQGAFSYVDKKSYDFLHKSKVFPDDIVICNVGEVGKCYKAPDLDMRMSLGPNAILCNQFDKFGILPNDYFFHYLISYRTQNIISSISSGSVQNKFNKTQFRKLNILIPPKNILNYFTNISNNIYKKSSIIFKQNKALLELTNIHLPKLISGQLKITDVEKLVEEISV